MNLSIVTDNIDLYLSGLWVTLQLTALSVTIGFCIALLFALLRNSRSPLLWAPAWGYIYVLRGTPMLVQLYLIYYGIGQFEFIKETVLWTFFREPYLCALLALTLNTSAYGAEIIRGALNACNRGEIEAATAYGMSAALRFRRILFPAAMRRALPSYANEVVLMLHATALTSTVTIIDLTGAARIVNSRFYSPFEAFLTVGLFYLALTMLLIGLFHLLEQRLHRHLPASA